MLNEMLDFGNGTTILALSFEKPRSEPSSSVSTDIKEGAEVKTTGKLLQVPVGKAMLGRVVNALGQPGW